jgi:RNA-directed DNA polymerase
VGRGLPIGSLTSQHLANFYLGAFDRFVKEQARVPGYVRYMDDMVLWSEDGGELRRLLPRCRDWLGEELGLELKPTPYLNRSRHGLDFLGCRVFPSHRTLNRRRPSWYFRRAVLQRLAGSGLQAQTG